MGLINCLKSIFGSGNVFTEEDITVQLKHWDTHESDLGVEQKGSPVVDERGRCSLCRKQRVLAHVNEMWYDAPVEKVLDRWLISEPSGIAWCFACTRDYLFQGQLRRREFNEYRN